MRTLLTQGHAQNLRDLILNYKLDKEGNRIIDFSYGKGGYWNIDYAYRCERVFTDNKPTAENVIQKNIVSDSYADLGLFDACIFDPPYLYGRQSFDYTARQKKGQNVVIPTALQGKNSWGSHGLDTFVSNKNPEEFTARAMAFSERAAEVLKSNGLAFVKVMDTRFKKELIDNHGIVIQAMKPKFKLDAICPYVKSGAMTWDNHTTPLVAHGYWLIFYKR